MIEVKNLYKRYHNHHGSDWVLKDINLTFPKNVSVGLIGANGAGKSTLLKLIAGMDTPERGEVIRHSRVSWPVGLAGGMQGNMTGRQNVKFVARAQGSGPDDVRRVIQFVEDFAEIGDAFDEPIRTYSSGMRSRISFGLSLAFNFDVYISDEATAVGDLAFKEKAQELFKSKIGQASIIMVSHSEGILKNLCQAGVYLKQGHATWYDDIKEAIDTYHADVHSAKAEKQGKAPAPTKTAKPDPNRPRIFPSMPDTLPEAYQHLSHVKEKLAEAERALDVARHNELLPIYRKHFRDDIEKRHQQIKNVNLHIQALKQQTIV